MPKYTRLRYLVFSVLFLLVSGVASLKWRSARKVDTPGLLSMTDDSSRSSIESGSVSTSVDRRKMLALPTVVPDVPTTDGGHLQRRDDDRTSPSDEAARQERKLMAKTWGMSRETYKRFEEAATARHWERKAVYDWMMREDVSRADFERELREADIRDNWQLREILGSHYQEYTLMRGHFAEAGLDHERFQPPAFERTDVDNRFKKGR